MTFIRSNRFLSLAFMISAAMLFLAAGSAMATGLVVETCTSCTTLAAFQNEAADTIPASAYNNMVTDRFIIVNPSASLLANILYHSVCLSTADGAPCTLHQSWAYATNSIPEMEEAYEMAAPPLAVQIPASVADTFTGTAQAPAVSAWLAQESSGVAVPLNTVVLTTYADGSSAEYQVTGTDPTSYSLISDSGRTPDGLPVNDSGQPINMTSYTTMSQPVTFNPTYHKELLAQIAWEIAHEEVTIGPHPCTTQACMSGSSVAFENFFNSFPVYLCSNSGFCGG